MNRNMCAGIFALVCYSLPYLTVFPSFSPPLCLYILSQFVVNPGMRLVPGQQLLFCPLGGGTSDSIYTGQVSC